MQKKGEVDWLISRAVSRAFFGADCSKTPKFKAQSKGRKMALFESATEFIDINLNNGVG